MTTPAEGKRHWRRGLAYLRGAFTTEKGTTLQARPIDDEWSEALNDDAQMFLLDLTATRTNETLQFIDAQDAKTVALLGVAIGLVGFSGVFGSLDANSSLNGVLSVLTVGSFIASSGVALASYWTRKLNTGPDVAWMSHFEKPTQRRLRDEALQIYARAFARNRDTAQRKGRLLSTLMVAVTIQTLLVVLVELTAPSPALGAPVVPVGPGDSHLVTAHRTRDDPALLPSRDVQVPRASSCRCSYPRHQGVGPSSSEVRKPSRQSGPGTMDEVVAATVDRHPSRSPYRRCPAVGRSQNPV
jgi:hypothetical protein